MKFNVCGLKLRRFSKRQGADYAEMAVIKLYANFSKDNSKFSVTGNP